MNIGDVIENIVKGILDFIGEFTTIDELIPVFNEYIVPPGVDSYEIVDIIMTFLIKIFNGLLSASRSLLFLFDNMGYTFGLVNTSIFDLMFGVGLPIFIIYMFATWIANLVT